MSYGMTCYKTLQTNLCAAGTTVMLCRANLEGVDLSEEEKSDLLWRLQCQITELENMRIEINNRAKENKILPILITSSLRVVD